MLRVFITACFLFVCVQASAQSPVSINSNSSSGIVNIKPELQILSKNPYWHHLLHYRAQGLLRTHYSQGDDPTFFLSNEGMTNPLAELNENIAAFAEINKADNISEQCRFPARYHWLKQQFPLNTFVDQSCSDLDKFTGEIAGDSLTVIFPASYLNSPSSMYGHTLVRIDRKNKNSSKLLSFSVNFAANADPTDNELVFSYKGIAGGYPGVVSVVPYYQKVNEYSSLESRDIWEYELNLTKTQVDQFVRHIWETKSTFFDYYFMGENCSYRLLALLDASTPELNLAESFPFRAVPVDTVRILHDKNLVKKITYRPSASTELNYMRVQSSSHVQALAKEIVVSDSNDFSGVLSGLSEKEKAQTLELAFSYSRYLSVQEKNTNKVIREKSLKILSARSKLEVKDVFNTIPTPTIRADEGHNTQRASIAYGEADGVEFTELGYRLTYHDLLDPIGGYLPGAKIQMGALKLRKYEDESLEVNQFKMIDITSLSTRNNFVKPTAWRISTGFERFPFNKGPQYWTVNGGGGVAYDALGGVAYGLLEAGLDIGSELDEGYRASLGGQVGYLYQQGWWQLHAHAQWNDGLLGMQGERTNYQIGVGFNPVQNLQLRLNLQQWEQEFKGAFSKKYDSVSMALGVYF
jgi:hypothetical protein